MESLAGTWKATLSVLEDMESSCQITALVSFVVDSNLAVG